MRPLTLRFAAPRIVELVETEVPEPEPGSVRVRTLFSGISSGTEMLAYRGELDPSLPLDESIGALGGTFEYPFEYGYSAVGVVEAKGAGAPQELGEGALVFSFQPHRSHFTAAPEDLVLLGDVDPREATLFPLVETALQISLDATGVEEGPVVVFGLGTVGLLAAALLARGGAEVLAVDPLDWRRTAVEEFGLESVPPDEVTGALGGRDAATVVEASGNPDALRAALEILRHEGEVLVCSWFGEKQVPLPLGREFHRRRLSIRSSQVSTIPKRLQATWSLEKRRQRAAELMSELPLGVLATHTFPVEEAAAAYSAIDAREPGLIHAALRYG